MSVQLQVEIVHPKDLPQGKFGEIIDWGDLDYKGWIVYMTSGTLYAIGRTGSWGMNQLLGSVLDNDKYKVRVLQPGEILRIV